jgi:uncharacterized membrane protein
MDRDLGKRFWEIDFLRGIAIVMMIVFHFLYDLNFFGVYPVDVYSGFWWLFARVTAAVFLLLVGISLTLSYSRALQEGRRRLWSKYLRRGLKIFCLGLAITAITWLFLGAGFIVFGVLHLIGVSVILAYPLVRHRYRNLLLGIIFIIAGLFLWNFVFESGWLLWLGFMPRGFYTLDYFPLFPWFGVVLIGLFLGNSLYRNYKRRFGFPDKPGSVLAKPVCFLGRHSLLVYFLHQPVLIALLYLLGAGDFGILLI